MNKVIEITIRNKVARIASSPIIVGKNKDYIVRFDFDEDWYKYDTKTARFSQDSEYQDIIFAGNECSMPALDGGKVVEVGVYAGDISTTTPAYLKVHKSIIDDDGVPADPKPDVYAQLMERFNAMEPPAAVLYTAQNLTDKQKAQARDNIGAAETGSGVDISLGIRGASAGQVPVVKSVDVNGVPNGWVAGDLPSGGEWDVHYKANITEALENGFTITEVNGEPLKLREMWAMVKLQNGSDTSTWMGCIVATNNGSVYLSTTSAGHGGVIVKAGEYAYFVYHAIVIGNGRAVCEITAGGAQNGNVILKTQMSWLNNWLDFYPVEYITGLKCSNNLGAGTSQGYGTEIELWGRNA